MSASITGAGPAGQTVAVSTPSMNQVLGQQQFGTDRAPLQGIERDIDALYNNPDGVRQSTLIHDLQTVGYSAGAAHTKAGQITAACDAHDISGLNTMLTSMFADQGNTPVSTAALDAASFTALLGGASDPDAPGYVAPQASVTGGGEAQTVAVSSQTGGTTSGYATSGPSGANEWGVNPNYHGPGSL